jgi:hypothetical protein
MFLGGEDSLAGKDCLSSSGPIDVGGGFGRHGGGARESWASQQQPVAGSGFGAAGARCEPCKSTACFCVCRRTYQGKRG